jgi:hypothetical protein
LVRLLRAHARARCARTRSRRSRSAPQGTHDHSGNTPAVDVALAAVDIAASALTVGFWIDKTYEQGVRTWIEYVECVPRCGASRFSCSTPRCVRQRD